jgi:hypothetical protein
VDTAGDLAIGGPAAAANSDLHLGVEPGTSPSIAGPSAGGFQISFAALGSNHVYDYGTYFSGDTLLLPAMMPGTSPSTTPTTSGCCQVAYVNTSDDLETGGPLGNQTTTLGVASGTSPSIVGLPTTGYETAFLGAGTDYLWFYGSFPAAYSSYDTGVTGESGTSPSITQG